MSSLDHSNTLRPHDLIWISDAGAVVSAAPRPAWVSDFLSGTPVVVVRRAAFDGGLVPIGVRGERREHRFAATVAPAAIVSSLPPEAVAAEPIEVPAARRLTLPALRAYAVAARRWCDIGRAWGPTGSVGFELATGFPVVTEASDLDLMIRSPERFSVRDGAALLDTLADVEAVADIQVEVPGGSFSLREYSNGRSPQIRLKTCDGPRLVGDPWTMEQGVTE